MFKLKEYPSKGRFIGSVKGKMFLGFDKIRVWGHAVRRGDYCITYTYTLYYKIVLKYNI